MNRAYLVKQLRFDARGTRGQERKLVRAINGALVPLPKEVLALLVENNGAGDAEYREHWHADYCDRELRAWREEPWTGKFLMRFVESVREYYETLGWTYKAPSWTRDIVESVKERTPERYAPPNAERSFDEDAIPF